MYYFTIAIDFLAIKSIIANYKNKYINNYMAGKGKAVRNPKPTCPK